MLRRLKIREQPDFLEHVPIEQLRFVNDKRDGGPSLMALDQVIVEVNQHLGFGFSFYRQTQIGQHILQKIVGGKPRVKNVGKLNIAALQKSKNALCEQGLARSYFARDHDKTFALLYAVHQAGQSLIVARRGAKEIWIRANFKRIASQPIKARVHSAMPSST